MLARMFAVVALLALGLPGNAASQASTELHADLGGSATLWQHGSVASLDAPVRLALEDVALPDALEAIARAAGLDLAYVSDALPGISVSLEGALTTAGEAFASVLEGTGLQVAGPTSSGHYVVVLAPVEPREELDGTVLGRVYDRSSGTALAGVSVYIEGTERAAVSGADGRFALTGVPAGSWTVRASSIGYAEESRSVVVEDGGTVSVDFVLETSAVSLDEIVVTGTVTPTAVKAVPTPITVVRATDIRRQNIQSVDELFRVMIPGGVQTVQSPGLGGFAEYTVRGISSLTGFSTIKILVDGIELENPAYVKAIDPASIERVEFISGPQASSVYGSGAVSGVMQIFTRKGLPGQGTQVRGLVAVGTIDDRYVEDRPLTQEYRLTVDGGGESFGYNLGGSWEEEGSWIPGARERAGNLYAGSRIEAGRLDADFSLRFRGDFDDMGLNPAERRVLRDDSDAPSTTRMDWSSASYGAGLTFHATERWDHRMVLGYDGGSIETYTEEPRRSTPADTFNSIRVSDRGVTSVRYHTTYRIPMEDHALTLIGGGDYSSHTQYTFFNSAIPSTGGPVGDFGSGTGAARGAQTYSGVFGQAQLDLSDALFLTAGIHGDNSPTQPSMAWSPRVGVSWVNAFGPTELKLRAAYGSALVAPDPAAQAGSVTQFVITLPNPGLAPERQKGYDAGAELYFGNRGSLQVTWFDQTAINLVTGVRLPQDQPFPIRFQFQNVGEIRNKGYEVAATFVPVPDLSLTAVYGATQSEVKALADSYTGVLEVGDELRRVPDWTGALTLGWTPVSGTSLDARVTHRAPWIETEWASYFGAFYDGTFSGNEKDYWIDYPAVTEVGVGLTQELTRSTSGFIRVENLTNNYNYDGHDLITPRGREMQVGMRFTLN